MPKYFVQAWDPAEMARVPHTPYWIMVNCANEEEAKQRMIRSMLLFSPELTADYFDSWIIEVKEEKTSGEDYI